IPTTRSHTRSLHDALPIWSVSAHGTADDGLTIVRVRVEITNEPVDLDGRQFARDVTLAIVPGNLAVRDQIDADLVLLLEDGLHRSEEHTSELQSRFDLVCR